MVRVIVASSPIGFFASPFSKFSACGASGIVSRSLTLTISAVAVKPSVGMGFAVFGTKTLIMTARSYRIVG
jgi:hypothetical protein